jgi:quercetin dioxygenase-like cupin family protein
MNIISEKKTVKGPEEWFTGEVDIEFLFDPIESGRTGGATVTFQPGARTAWHTHPFGQTLIITAGKGWVQVDGEDKHEVQEGDVVQFAPEEKHWHGATSTDALTHIAIQESKDGKSVDWLEHVSNEEYLGD